MNILLVQLYAKIRKDKRVKNQNKRFRIKKYKISTLFRGCSMISDSMNTNNDEILRDISIGYGSFTNINDLHNRGKNG